MGTNSSKNKLSPILILQFKQNYHTPHLVSPAINEQHDYKPLLPDFSLPENMVKVACILSFPMYLQKDNLV